jgi:protein-disulfide isomerase
VLQRIRSLTICFVVIVAGCANDAARTSDPSNVGLSSSSLQNGPSPPVVAVVPTEPFVRVDAARALGSSSATVAIVEFADYQCPYCRGFHVGTLPKLHESYIETGKVRYFYLDFPLSIHEHAFGAAVAARCAGEQGQYWQMQELLYAEQARLGRDLYPELAAELNLDAERFKTCLGAGTYSGAVRGDLAEGRRVGVSGTPTFIIGYVQKDRVLIKRTAVGAPSFEVFVRELDALAR